MAIRLTENTVDAMCNAAETLKARFFVALDDRKWCVYDMRRAEKFLRAWVLPEPTKVFEQDQHAAAEMWALHRRDA